MANERSVRIERQAESRPSDTWLPQSSLPVPEPKDGWVFRWIRTSIMGQADPTNTSAKFREGWEPVKASDQPKLMLQADPNSRFKDNIEIGGLLLCKAPQELMQQRDAYYNAQAKAQVESVDNSFMRLNDERMPLFSDKKTTVSFGKGK